MRPATNTTNPPAIHQRSVGRAESVNGAPGRPASVNAVTAGTDSGVITVPVATTNPVTPDSCTGPRNRESSELPRLSPSTKIVPSGTLGENSKRPS